MLDNNSISAADLTFPATGYLSDEIVLKDVRISYKKDSEGKLTKEIDSVRYQGINRENYDSVTIKVMGAEPVIDPEEFRKSDSIVILEIPVDKTIIKPYEISYGKAKVSIIAPHVKIVKS